MIITINSVTDDDLEAISDDVVFSAISLDTWGTHYVLKQGEAVIRIHPEQMNELQRVFSVLDELEG